MDDENPDGIDEILLSLQANDEDLLPTLTLYTGERLPSDPKPPVNLHLSLGGAYTGNSNATPCVQESAAVDNYLSSFVFADNSSRMKRSYLEQNKMVQRDQEEIILIDNFPGITRGKRKSQVKDTAPDIDWAAQSASKNPALQRAIEIIKSDSSQQRPATRTKADHNQGDTSDKSHAIRLGVGSQPNDHYDTYGMSHAIQGLLPWHPEIGFQSLERGNSMNPDDFLSISPSNCEVNVDIGLSFPSNQDPSKETSADCSIISPAPMRNRVTANAELQTPEKLAVPILFPTASDKGKSVMILEPSRSATILSAPITYYGTSADGNLINNFSARKSGPAAFATASSSSRSAAYMPQLGAIGSGNSIPSTCFPHSYPAMAMANPVPRYMASSSNKENGIPNLMHYDPHMANANLQPAAFAYASNTWSNASIPVAVPISGFPTGGNNSVVIPPVPAKVHPLMKRNEYLPDSQVEVIRHMPTVATDGGIPDGRRIEGFLYQYSNHEEVIIVCFCHGSFFTPREFVMHAGGGEVENPMRLITIVPDD